MATKDDKKAKKAKASKARKSGLAAAATKRLERIGGGGGPKMSPEQLAHVMVHAEERGDAERVDLEDGTWGWKVQGPDGKLQILKPTAEILAALQRFEIEGHPAHDDDA